jgi:hypothetical protein
MGSRTFAVEVDDADIPEFRRAGDQRIQQDGRRRRGTMEVDLLAGADTGDGLRGGDDSHG